jgi:hypothetical protein
VSLSIYFYAKCHYKAVFTLAKISAIMPVTIERDSNTLVLALATLGGTTEIETILSVLRRPRLPTQVRQWRKIANSFANKFHQCKGFIKGQLSGNYEA